ncbi:MAG: NAD synthetase, partial [Candidatus Aminicenantes bacterium]|nr:NAD synthetase [Candidatus Aminicenantes bacterium]NIN44652.1 NAD synthetase [Candidatus Aminicenantes bacterium]NIT25720.1 NAD synthetase [Candidatus Aminicenantes bacterium]
DYRLVLAALAIGSVIGAISASTVQMTHMPQMVALFNGFGGGASGLVALSSTWPKLGSQGDTDTLTATVGAAPATTI